MSNLAASPGALGLRSPQHVCGVRSPPPTPRFQAAKALESHLHGAFCASGFCDHRHSCAWL